jgi:aryl carrier-like protein
VVEPSGVPPDATPSVADVVATAWADALGVDRVDPDTGFFDLGADSLTVLRVVVALREHWPQLRVVDIFANPSVSSLSEFLARA